MIHTRLLTPTATWQRRCIKLLPSFSSTTSNNVLMCNTQTQRPFATQKKKKHNKGGNNKPQDVYKQQIKAQQQQSSSIIGKRPGQTSFSPPTEKIVLEASTSASTTQSLSTPNKTKSNTGANIKHTHRPLIIPPSIQSSIDNQPLSSSSSSSSYTDNKNVAHTQPSISKYTQELIDKEDNILRQQFLREGILPPPDRPNVTKTSTTTTNNQSTNNITPVEIPEAHPSGVSHANPEDILDMASMYDPSIHLPDKPNFNSPTNRIKYEAGTPLTDELIAYIGVRGPITVAEYMRRVLRDGRYGYYTSKGSRSGQKMSTGGAAITVGAVDTEDDIDDDNDWDLDDGDDSSSSDEQVGGGEQVIGPSGDFITAPEVSQLFGESLLVWLMTQYQTLNNPSKIQIIEIGPGKGTLICDIVRSAISTFPDFASALTSSSSTANSNDEESSGQENRKVAIGVHLVEVANGMRSRQRESLQHLENEKTIVGKGYSFQFSDSSLDDDTEDSDANSSSSNKSDSSSIETGKEDQSTICFSWHDVLSSVPTHDTDTGEPIPTFIICQELVDALPVHSFQKIEGNVWRERLVDVAIRDEKEASEAANDIRSAVTKRFASAEELNDTVSTKSSSTDSSTTEDNNNKKLPRLRFVLPPDTTPALRSMLRVDNRGSPTDDNPSAQTLNSLPVGSIIEACPEGLVLAQDIADRIEKCNGGAALIIDYGGDGSSGGDTLRGFWKHTQVHPLSRPGEIDVTADVDFGALREAVNQRMSAVESINRKQRQEGKKSNVENDTLVEQPLDESNQHKPEAFGPITQGNFLAQMGIVQRVEKKIEDPETTDDQAYGIYSAMEWLMVPEQMGERFKVLAIAPKKQGLFPPPAF